MPRKAAPIQKPTNVENARKKKTLNWWRSSMGQELLSSLGILPIEQEYSDKTNFDSIIHELATTKCRKIQIFVLESLFTKDSELISNTFNAEEDGSVLCRILRIEYISESKCDIKSTQTTSFPILFKSATYCQQCVTQIKELDQILQDIDELERKLDYGRKTLEETLRGSYNLDVEHRDPLDIDSGELEPNYIQDLRKQIIDRLDEKDELISTSTKVKLNKGKRFTTRFVRKMQLRRKVVNHPEIKIQSLLSSSEHSDVLQGEENISSGLGLVLETEMNPGNEIIDDEIDEIMPPSPTHSFVSSASFEEKYVMPYSPKQGTEELENEPEPLELSLDAIHSKSQQLPTVRISSSKGVLNGTRLQCPHHPECRKTFDSNDQFRLSAHIKRYHEGIKRCYICDVCGEGFIRGDQLERHIFIHQVPENLNSNLPTKNVQVQNFNDCILKSGLPVVTLNKLKETEITSLGCRTPSNLKRKYHAMETSSRKSRASNKQINKSTKSKPKLRRVVINEGRNTCPHETCNRTFKVTEEWKRQAHFNRIHKGVKNCYICEICNESFASYRRFEVHESIHTGISPYICTHCQEVCRSRDHLKLHIAREHKPELIKFKCEYCDMGFIKEDRHRLHLLSHTKKREFLCELCSKGFQTATYLRYHQSKHHYQEAPFEPFKCNECGKIFSAPSNLRGHIMKQHRGEFKHQCQLCEYGALTLSALNTHMIGRHCDERNFKCNICPATFKLKSALKIHNRTHTGERPYICKTCGKDFHEVSRLRRHELIHSRSQCHICEICGKKFPVRNYLYIHMRSHNKTVKYPKQIRNKRKNRSKNTNSSSSNTSNRVEIIVTELDDSGQQISQKNIDLEITSVENDDVLQETSFLPESNLIFEGI